MSYLAQVLFIDDVSGVASALGTFGGYGVCGAVAILALTVAAYKDRQLTSATSDFTQKLAAEKDARIKDQETARQLIKAESDARIKDAQDSNKILVQSQANITDSVRDIRQITDVLDDVRRGLKP